MIRRFMPCTSCHGVSTILDPLSGEVEPYCCPDCGGTGYAYAQLTPVWHWHIEEMPYDMFGDIFGTSASTFMMTIEPPSTSDAHSFSRFYESYSDAYACASSFCDLRNRDVA